MLPVEALPFIINPIPKPINIPPKIAANKISCVIALIFITSFKISVKLDSKITTIKVLNK